MWQAHFDYSQALAAEGIAPTLVSAGKYKVDGNPTEPLGSDARDYLQSRVNDYYGTFTRAVGRNRSVDIAQVRDGMGQGRVVGAQAAKTQGMVDDVATFDQVIRKMMKSIKQGGTAASNQKGNNRATLARREIDILNA